MACCGKGREQLRGTSPQPQAFSPGSSAMPPPPARRFVACFEYVGRTALTVLGPVTGKRYRFDGPGARVVVDLRDRPSLAAVPHLREIRNFT
jgi:hypothetical protein